MYLLMPLLAAWACLVPVGLAAPAVAFTNWPTTVYTGQPTTLSWSGDPKADTTITLKRGSATDLRTIKVLTTQATGGAFTWTPDESLPEGSDYALQINQKDSINYTGLLTVAHKPGKESSPSAASKKPVPSDTTPLGGVSPPVAKGNNGYVPALGVPSSRLNMTSNKSTAKTSGGVSFRYFPLQSIMGALAALAAIGYFAA